MKYQSSYLRGPDKNGRGKWQGFLRYKGEGGKWRQVSRTFGDDVKTEKQATKALEAWKVEKELEAVAEDEAEAAALAAHHEPTVADLPVGEYVSSYIDVLETAGAIRPSAVTDYRISARHIADGLGGVTMGKLSPTKIQKWEAGLLRSGRSASTVLKYHRLLNAAYKFANSQEQLSRNPCAAVKKPRRPTPSPNSLTAVQLARLAKTLGVMEPTPTVTAAAIAMYTGMREGEVCGLRWKSYDAGAGTIRVENAVAKAGGKTYETDPKTKESRRDVPVEPMLARMLERRRAIMVEDLQVAGITLEDDEFGELFVVGTVDGRYMHPVLLSKSWKTLSESFGLIGTQGRAVTFHDLRHSYATRAIAQGADVKSVAANLGHADAHVTLNIYADADKESKRRTAALVEQSILEQGDVEPFAELAEPV